MLVGGSPVRVLRLTAAGLPAGGVLVRRDAGAGPGGLPLAGPPPARRGHRAPEVRRGRRAALPGAADVTVVIPVRDRHTELDRCLAAAAATLASATRPGRPARPAAGDRGRRRVRRPGGDQAHRGVSRRGRHPPAGQRRPRRRAQHRPRGGAAQNSSRSSTPTACPHPAGWTACCRTSPTRPSARWRPASCRTRRAPAGWPGTRARAPPWTWAPAASVVRPGARVPYVPGAALVVRRAAAGDGFRRRHARRRGRRLRLADGRGRLAGPLRAGRGHGPRPPGHLPRLVRPPRRLRHVRRRARAAASRRGPPPVRLLVDGRRVGGRARPAPGRGRRAHRRRDRPARPPPVPRHRRALARPAAAVAPADNSKKRWASAAGRTAPRGGWRPGWPAAGPSPPPAPSAAPCRAPGGRSRSQPRLPSGSCAPRSRR